jgi:septal ring factor EnvC (AmiA/AmiB activator)
MHNTTLPPTQSERTPPKEALEQSEERLRFFHHELKQERSRLKELTSKVKSLRLKTSYFNSARTYRASLKQYHIWEPGAWVVLPPALGLVMLILIDLITGFRPVSVVGAVLMIVISLVALLALSKYPSDAELPQHMEQTKNELAQLSRKAAQTESRIGELQQGLEQELALNANLVAQNKERERISSARYQCQQLFNENWRAMRSVEFEQYLERVFQLLGYQTQTTNTTGDQGVDLIVEKAGRKIAVQVKGYFHSVSNSAIQQAFTGMRYYNCHACAVVTNSKFTASAIELAESTNCVLIHEDNFREFVFGEIEFV